MKCDSMCGLKDACPIFYIWDKHAKEAKELDVNNWNWAGDAT